MDQSLKVSLAFAKRYRLTLQLSRQVLASLCGEAHRIDHLRRSVIVFSWYHEPLSRIATHNLSFQHVYGKVEAALQLSEKSNLAQLKDKASSFLPRTD